MRSAGCRVSCFFVCQKVLASCGFMVGLRFWGGACVFSSVFVSSGL